MTELSKAMSWGRLLHLTQKQRYGVITDQELVEMRRLRAQQRGAYARVRRNIEPLMGDWTRL